MYQSPSYPSPPPGYGDYGAYYAHPRYNVHTSTPSPRGSPKVHARHSSQSYARVPPQFIRYNSAPAYGAAYASPQRDYVSDRKTGHYRGERKQSKSKSKPQAFAYDPVYDTAYGAESYHYNRTPPPPYETYRESREADYRYHHDQVPIYTEAQHPTTPKANTHARRASHAARPQTSPPKPKPTSTKKPRVATADDARRAGIPAGFSYKNWDPSEEPIILLGSVFDANSLGKWIYDWTVFDFGPATPMAGVAGDLWLLLIQLAGKVKRADDSLSRIRREENRELVDDFVDAGERIFIRFKKLLKLCEDFMMKAAQRETGEKKPTQMSKSSGVAFVECMFGRDKELDQTEKLMSAIRLWSMRFDANCEEILRNPTV